MFNLFQYISFRAAGAMVTALLVCFVAGPPIIRRLESRNLGQVVRLDVLGRIRGVLVGNRVEERLVGILTVRGIDRGHATEDALAESFDDVAAFETDLDAWRQAAPPDRVVPGIGVYKHAAGDLTPQLAACRGTAGWSLFAYSSLLESANPEQDRSEAALTLRQRLCDALTAATGHDRDLP